MTEEWGEKARASKGADEGVRASAFAIAMTPPGGQAKVRPVTQKTLNSAARLLRALDSRRIQKDMTKADLARQLGKHPASFRRLLGSVSNPELFTLIQIANALDADIVLKPRKKRVEYEYPREWL